MGTLGTITAFVTCLPRFLPFADDGGAGEAIGGEFIGG